jgi:hypothetical protein
MIAYFIRRAAGGCSVIKLYADDCEEVVQDGLSAIEAEILCAMKIADIPRPTARPIADADPKPQERIKAKRRGDTRQLALEF